MRSEHSRAVLENPRLLIATNDDELRVIACSAAKLLGCLTVFLKSGDDLLTRSGWATLSLLLLDQDLGDTPALEMARAFRRDQPMLPFVLIGKRLSVATTVEAMKLGAFTVLEKPVSWNEILAAFRGALAPFEDNARSRPFPALPAEKPRSIMERWVLQVVKACRADGDLKTIAAWASFTGLSYSSLCESCRLIGIQPHDARDFMRVLRAVVRADRQGCQVEELLDISDRRTLKSLMERAGLDSLSRDSRTVDEFLSSQRFVPPGHAVLDQFRTLIYQQLIEPLPK